VNGPTLLLLGPAEVAPPVPYDLAAAIEARFTLLAGSTLAGITDIRESEADSGVVAPYLVYKITSGSPELITSDSQWDDRRVRFELFAASQEQANLLRDAVVAGYDGEHNEALAFSSGLSTAFRRVDLAEGKQKGRSNTASYVFSATAFYQVRVRLGRPS
jgi:hypothetical protein